MTEPENPGNPVENQSETAPKKRSPIASRIVVRGLLALMIVGIAIATVL